MILYPITLKERMVVSPFEKIALKFFEDAENESYYVVPAYDPVLEYMKKYCRRRVYLPVFKHTRSHNLEKTIDTASHHLDTAGTIFSKNIAIKLPEMRRKVSFSNRILIHRY